MALVSLKRYLSRTEDESVYRKIISLLLSGIAEHAVGTEIVELNIFREEIRAIREAAEAECVVERLHTTAESAIQALETYSTRTTGLVRRRKTELQNMITMLAQTVISIGGGSERSAGALREIKLELEQAAVLEDVQKLRLRLGECLERVRTEASRQKDDAAAVVLELKRSVETAQALTTTDLDIDPVTYLPGNSAAKAAFAEAIRTPGRKYIVTMVLERLRFINARFGNAVGDEVLRTWRKYIESEVLRPEDRLFRWQGPALVALMPRPDSMEHIRRALKPLLDKRIEKAFDVGTRSALLPLSVAWSAIELEPPLANLVTCLDQFVAAQAPN